MRSMMTKCTCNGLLATTFKVKRPTTSYPLRVLSRYRCNSTASGSITIDGKTYPTDSWTNVTPSITSFIPRKLHLQQDHPISIIRNIIESCFSPPTYAHYHTFSPIVSTHQNFDSLCFPSDHPGRSKTDTYYVNATTVLRTHTSAHQVDIFRANTSQGYLVSADVYRRDAIDRSHYPIFHQMEGAQVWDRRSVPNGDLVAAVSKDISNLPKHEINVEDTKFDETIIQLEHRADEAKAVAAHLKHVLELVMVKIFSLAKKAAAASNIEQSDALKMRWVEGSFPFTLPSWELEVYWQGDWLEVLGCGVVKQKLLSQAGVPDQIGWAFGVGLERIAMLLFEIPDIRLFWSQDERFLSQFTGVSEDLTRIKRFCPFSKYPKTYKDVAFWIPDTPNSAENDAPERGETHENDIMQIVRDVAGDMVENVSKVDEFKHPKTGRVSWCYRVNYRSLEKTLTSSEANELHEKVRVELVKKLGVELR